MDEHVRPPVPGNVVCDARGPLPRRERTSAGAIRRHRRPFIAAPVDVARPRVDPSPTRRIAS